jgi:hypothetical protein
MIPVMDFQKKLSAICLRLRSLHYLADITGEIRMRMSWLKYLAGFPSRSKKIRRLNCAAL